LGFCDFNVIAVLSSLFPSQRYPLFAFLSQHFLILFSSLYSCFRVSETVGWRGRRAVVRTAIAST
ncbi:hypothetical protein, partial [Plesiomonas shigelloides]|uniref:hypothetical protein n=1 Tax=Plesiomonas shigelloides TaxID=703 RepID=UPI001E40352F